MNTSFKIHRISTRLQEMEFTAGEERAKAQEKGLGYYGYFDGEYDTINDVIVEIHNIKLEVDALLRSQPGSTKEDVLKILQKLRDRFETNEQIYRNSQGPVDNTVDRYNTGKANAYLRWHRQILSLIEEFQLEGQFYQS